MPTLVRTELPERGPSAHRDAVSNRLLRLFGVPAVMRDGRAVYTACPGCHHPLTWTSRQQETVTERMARCTNAACGFSMWEHEMHDHVRQTYGSVVA